MGHNKLKKYKIKLDSIFKKKGLTFLRYLLDAGFDVNAVNNYGTTMLCYAAEWGNLEIAEFLVKNGADANLANSNGSKPLHIASRWGQKDIVKFLLNSGISVNSVHNDNCTPLHYVIAKSEIGRENYGEIIHILAENNADLNWVDSNGLTPLLRAAQKPRKYIVELLLKLGAKVDCLDENEWNILHCCCVQGWFKLVEILLRGRFGMDINSKTISGESPLSFAFLCSRKKMVKLLIKSGADYKCTNSTGWTILHCSVWSVPDLKIVKFLVNEGCDVNAKTSYGATPVIEAAWNLNSKPIVEYLIDYGVDVNGCNVDGWTLLHLACRNKWLEIIKSIVKKNADINAQNFENDTPLHIAVEAYKSDGKTDLIKYLLNAGANCNIENIRGKTPFNIFIKNHRDREVVYLFIINGAYFQSEDYFWMSNSALHIRDILSCTPVSTMGILNKFNHIDLLKLYTIPGVSEKLPSIERLKIASGSCVAQDMAKSVNYEIKTTKYCNVLKKRPIGLIQLCVQTLVEHYTSLNVAKLKID